MTEILSLDTMGELKMNELLNKMTEIDSSSIKYIFLDNNNEQTAAVVVLKGKDTSKYIDALDAQETAIRAESAVTA